MFRSEALAHAGNRRYGEVLLANLPSTWFLTASFSLVALGIVLFFACFSVTRKVQVPGILLPSGGLIRVVPLQGGLVVERLAREGQMVQANEVLFVLASERGNAQQGNTEQTIARLLTSRRDSLLAEQAQSGRQSAQRLAVANRRIAELSEAISRLGEQVSLQRRRVAIAEEVVARHADLQSANFVSAAQVRDKQAELLDQQQRVADLQRLQAAATRDLSAARADASELAVQSLRDQESVQRSVAALEQELAENEARRRIFVRAPQSGVLTTLTADLGQTVAAGQPLAAIIPEGSELEAELYPPSRAAGFLKPGMPVLIRYHAYAYQKFGQSKGTVTEVSKTALTPDELRASGGSRWVGGASEPVYRVRVALARQSVAAYGTGQPLKAGDLLDASVLLESRRLFEWALEPLYTIAGRV